MITRRIRKKKLVCYLGECVLLQHEGPLHRLRCASQRNHKRSVSSSSHSCYTSFTPSENIIAQTHWWHSSEVKRVKTYWSGKSHQHVLVARPAAAAELPPAAQHLFFSLSILSFFFFLTEPSSRSLSPSSCEMVKHWAICTTLSWIVLRCLAVAAVTDDRLGSFVCVFTPQKK